VADREKTPEREPSLRAHAVSVWAHIKSIAAWPVIKGSREEVTVINIPSHFLSFHISSSSSSWTGRKGQETGRGNFHHAINSHFPCVITSHL